MNNLKYIFFRRNTKTSPLLQQPCCGTIILRTFILIKCICMSNIYAYKSSVVKTVYLEFTNFASETVVCTNLRLLSHMNKIESKYWSCFISSHTTILIIFGVFISFLDRWFCFYHVSIVIAYNKKLLPNIFVHSYTTVWKQLN